MRENYRKAKARRWSAFIIALIIGLLLIFSLVLSLTENVYADLPGADASVQDRVDVATEREDVKKELVAWNPYLSQYGFLSDGLREIGWGIIKFLTYICDGLAGGIKSIYSLLEADSLIQNEKFLEYYHSLKPFLSIVAVIALSLFGYYLIFKRADAPVGISQNLIAIILVLTAMPQIAGLMGNLTSGMSEDLSKLQTDSSAAAVTIVNTNVVDLYWVDQQNESGMPLGVETWSQKSKNEKKFSTYSDLTYTDATEVIDPDEMGLNNEDFFSYELVASQSKGEYSTRQIDSGGLIKLFTPYYYRYSVGWFAIMVQLIAFAITLIVMSFKSVHLVIQVLMSVISSPFVALTDLASGSRIKEFMRNFVALFATFFLITLFMGLFYVGVDLLNSVTFLEGNFFLRLLFFVVLCYSIIDGPNIIEKIIGVDAGLSSGWKMLAGAYAGSRLASSIGRGAAHSTARGAAAMKRATVGSPFKRDQYGERAIGGIAGAAMKWRQDRKDPSGKSESFGSTFKRKDKYGMPVSGVNTEKGRRDKSYKAAKEQRQYYEQNTRRRSGGERTGSVGSRDSASLYEREYDPALPNSYENMDSSGGLPASAESKRVPPKPKQGKEAAGIQNRSSSSPGPYDKRHDSARPDPHSPKNPRSPGSSSLPAAGKTAAPPLERGRGKGNTNSSKSPDPSPVRKRQPRQLGQEKNETPKRPPTLKGSPKK
jgi:hypothetical protein